MFHRLDKPMINPERYAVPIRYPCQYRLFVRTRRIFPYRPYTPITVPDDIIIGHELDNTRRDTVKETFCAYPFRFFFGYFLFVYLVLEILFPVKIGHLFPERTRLEIQRQKAFDFRLCHSMRIKALFGYHFLNSVRAVERLHGVQIPTPRNEQKLSCRCHFHLDFVQERNVFFQQFLDLRVLFFFRSVYQMRLVPVKAFRRVQAHDFDIGNGRKHHRQLMHFYLHACRR